VGLPFERAVMRVRQRGRERLARVAHPCKAFSTVHDEGRYRNGRPPFGRLRLASLVVPYDRAVVRPGVRNRFELRPHRPHRFADPPRQCSPLWNGCLIGGQVGVGDKARIESKAVIGSGAGILSSKIVHAGEPVWGTPARPLRQYLRQLATLSRLAKRRGTPAD